MQDIRKEQLFLLRLEKQIAGLAATLAVGAGVAKAADAKLGATEAGESFAQLQAALVNLAEVATHAHVALNEKAAEAGARVLEASGGVPKEVTTKVVASILGLG